VAVVAAGVGHEDAEEGHPHSWRGIQITNVEGPQGAHTLGVLETWRDSVPIVARERHEEVELLFQIHPPHAPWVKAPATLTEENPKVKNSL
jgi:hypothetical protein